MKFLFLYPLLLLLFTTCAQQKNIENVPLNEQLFDKGESGPAFKSKLLKEASGMVASQRNPGLFWVHNDSGDEARIFLIDSAGNIHREVTLNQAENVDWEDIAINTQPPYQLFIGDIGDNKARRENLVIYRLTEPVLSGQIASASDCEKMTIQYQNGARDAESLLFDHISQHLVIVSKRDDSAYVYSFPFVPDTSLIIAPKTRLPYIRFTAGTSNVQGEILLKTYTHVLYWAPSTQSMVDHFSDPPVRLPYEPEEQGEAICWSPDGNFYTLSELDDAPDQRLVLHKRL